ncbi:M20/M25/M40 family metallo-hydrolase [Rivularia sp. UHCC 0363]|uniref:M20/M25/M40 family metallo-hydrolase n=1 Tax=Rivularia sp. UHCC 0363 TaxID=3110244 RepID=UPI002B208245|nr:M20/M25/M40 family metallo-hydrolase [Rivularia sp. UHCC 0363]MEA5597906.1 M20/M25/M40 family metallo-hydrolase [Rivularia sp. UHCC 0363]
MKSSLSGSIWQASLSKSLFLLLILLLSVVIALWQLIPPAVIPASAPLTEFSAQRAMQDLAVIAQKPRPMGSAGNIAAREYLVEELTAMGLQPTVQKTAVVQRFPGSQVFESGTVYNVVARLQGGDRTGALAEGGSSGSIALDAHYDSGATGPGASDCGSCVVTLLETARILKNEPSLKNDVIFVFTDGEENGDLGARGFVKEHPWAKDIRLAINFEAMGSGGPSLLYKTSPNNNTLIKEFIQAVPHPFVSSLFSSFLNLFSAQRLGCDLEEYMDYGSAGLGFFYGADTPAYHTARDSIEVIDPRSIQHQGSYALGLVRHFGNLDLSNITADINAVYFNILPGVVIYYSQAWVIPQMVITGLLLIAVVIIAIQRKQLTLKGISLSAVAFILSIVGAVVVVNLVWWFVKVLNSNLQIFIIGYYQSNIYQAALIALTIAVMSAFYTWLLTRFHLHDLFLGTIFVWAALMVLTSLLMPGASYLFTLPLFFSLLGLGWIFLKYKQIDNSWQQVIILSVTAIPGIILLIPDQVYHFASLMSRFESLTNIPFTTFPMVFFALLFGLMLPHFVLLRSGFSQNKIRRRWLIPGIAGFLSVLLIGVATVNSGFDAKYPKTNSIAYVLDADSDKSFWMSSDRNLDEWTSQFFTDNTAKSQVEISPFWSTSSWKAPAPKVSLEPPNITIDRDIAKGSSRKLQLKLNSPRQANIIQAQVKVPGILTASINGKLLDLSEFTQSQRSSLNFVYHNLPSNGISLTLSVKSIKPIEITLKDYSNGLPPQLKTNIKKRTDTMMSAPMAMKDPTIVSRKFVFPLSQSKIYSGFPQRRNEAKFQFVA